MVVTMLAIIILMGGLKTLNNVAQASGNTNCRIDPGFYATQSGKPIDANFGVTFGSKTLDPNFFVGKCNK